jgi:alkanesulfonate monooxygenase SsuD/methylene tetrahydromethanopterin reductase-like flavin-dependent oxidoreductase (luciferase family)
MKFGFVISKGSTDEILTLTREAEAAGWDGVFTWDAISVGTVDTYDPWTLLGAMATVTSRVTLGAMIFPLARRRPWKVAREAMTVDHLSHGRLVIPVALGVPDDGGFSRVNTDTTDRRTRAQKLDETLEILDLAWSGEKVSFEGEHYQMKDLVFRPRPVQQPRIPIWVVASWPHERSLRRAVQWDGMLPSVSSAPMDPIPAETLAQIREWIFAHRNAEGPFEIILEGITDGADHEATRARLQPLADAGATWWIESRWDETETGGTLLDRIRQGPPRI